MGRSISRAAFALIGGIALGAPAVAEAPKPFEDFTFKKVAPPSKGSRKKRINIHITPEDMARQNPRLNKKAEEPKVAALAPAKPQAAATGRYSWFWDSISPDLDKGAPARLEAALIRVANPPGGKSPVTTPRLQGLQEIARTQGAHILRATVGTEVSPALVLAVIAVESAGRADAVSGAGAQGLMQLMPVTATRFGVEDALKPDQNIQGGVAFLDHLMKTFDRDPMLVLAGYNAGENAVKNAKGVPAYVETRDYVPKVLAAFQTAKGLCRTPPQLLSDGCVFNIDVSGGN
ncbi:lytic transglycosylase domain-containing protein [Rhodalgimonas zhirmunskyi]|uniref:Lytic transglycosylase domain-containing protein n=1 Tax=Rhodalgimonas zhirmunskyi TaxID=2964767 RepID=A0AAJ1X538_9RHOB|nr:lytic transglycosylase domain-containing protein [Rhodoalgimonas zhirmunskyi]MDQ2093769.1 lytic transglycosylase domain-containing protein [Rhodoalgimonas zhirmunskyi]